MIKNPPFLEIKKCLSKRMVRLFLYIEYVWLCMLGNAWNGSISNASIKAEYWKSKGGLLLSWKLDRRWLPKKHRSLPDHITIKLEEERFKQEEIALIETVFDYVDSMYANDSSWAQRVMEMVDDAAVSAKWYTRFMLADALVILMLALFAGLNMWENIFLLFMVTLICTSVKYKIQPVIMCLESMEKSLLEILQSGERMIGIVLPEIMNEFVSKDEAHTLKIEVGVDSLKTRKISAL